MREIGSSKRRHKLSTMVPLANTSMRGGVLRGVTLLFHRHFIVRGGGRTEEEGEGGRKLSYTTEAARRHVQESIFPPF
jgi:hypothetical protein